jgi:hypothetical protein
MLSNNQVFSPRNGSFYSICVIAFRQAATALELCVLYIVVTCKYVEPVTLNQ